MDPNTSTAIPSQPGLTSNHYNYNESSHPPDDEYMDQEEMSAVISELGSNKSMPAFVPKSLLAPPKDDLPSGDFVEYESVYYYHDYEEEEENEEEDTNKRDRRKVTSVASNAQDRKKGVRGQLSSLSFDAQDATFHPCETCGSEFKGAYPRLHLERHMRLKHSKPKRDAIYECQEASCEEQFRRQDARLKHMRIVHPDSASAHRRRRMEPLHLHQSLDIRDYGIS